MAVIDRIRDIFVRQPKEDTKPNKKLPFVHLFGTERSYGSIEPQDFNKQVAAYSSWAYACSWKNATSVAKNKICIYKKNKQAKGKEELEEIYEHPFLDLVSKVNPFSNRFELMAYTQLFLEITGNAYWWIPRDNFGVPYMIWCIPANWMRIVPSKTQFIEGYIMTVPGKGEKVPFDEKDIIHFKFPSPLNLYYGSGPLIAGAHSIDLNKQVKEWAINFFMNNAAPSGILQSKHSLSDDEYSRLRDAWNKKHRGRENAGKIAILENDLEYVQTGSNIKDTRFELVSRELRDEILAMFGVPASKLGLVEDVNRANADANDYTYQKETIYPRLVLIEEKLNEKLLPMYLNGTEDLVIKFENPVPEDNEYRLKEKEINLRIGMTTIDEERQKEGLEPFNLPETTMPLIPFNLIPAGSPKPTADSLGNPIDDEDSEKDDKKDDKKDEKKIRATESGDDKKWRVFANMTITQERAYAESVSRFFAQEHKEVMKNLYRYKGMDIKQKGIYEDLLIIINGNKELFKARSNGYIKQAITTGLILGGEEVGDTVDFNLFDINILRMLEKRADFVTEKVGQGSAEMLKEALEQAVKNGESIEKIAGRIDRLYDFNEKFRAKRIAQTEIIGATNEGKLASFEYAGVEFKKWITARDESVRDSHKIDGQTVERTQPFHTNDGNYLSYPGDRTLGAPASDVINCRCTFGAVLK